MTTMETISTGGRMEDAELLRRYAVERSEKAFAELVRRHLAPVYGFALRRVGGDAHLAEDVVQVVFTALARKAAGLADRPVLGGWLCRTAHYAARDVVRAERRRRTREQEALIMDETLRDDAAARIEWEKLQPLLAQMMGELNDADRDAVWLRFFEGRSFAEVGVRLRLTENTARMRVERALDKLHAALGKRGVTSTTAALGIALANQAAASVPAGLAASVTGAALAGATAGGVGVGAWVAVFSMSKIQLGVAAVIIVAAALTGSGELRANRELRAEIGRLQAVGDGAAQHQEEAGRLSRELQVAAAANPGAEEVVRLRERAAVRKTRPPGVTDGSMKAAAACQNVGRATPEALLETLLWAATTGDTEAMMQSYAYTEEMKVGLAAFFAKQSEVVRARYGTPERLLGEIWRVQNHELPAAFHVLREKRSYKGELDAAEMQVWMRRPTGEEKSTSISLQRGPEGWGIVAPNYPEDQWAALGNYIDPATGALRVGGK